MARSKLADHLAFCGRGKLTRSEYLDNPRGYAPKGEKSGKNKLTNEQVEDIRSAGRQAKNMREFIKENLSDAALARIYGVCESNIRQIINRETWYHIN